MKKWENFVGHHEFEGPHKFMEYLDERKKDGWRVVSVFPDPSMRGSLYVVVVFEREIPETPDPAKS